MTTAQSRIRCAIYTRKSSEEGLEQSFNSLQAQREACEAFIASQRHEGWHALHQHYDDGGFSGPELQSSVEGLRSQERRSASTGTALSSRSCPQSRRLQPK